ncbi:MAG: isocitrate/isopropylmalate dehydrogenase family protein [Anaerolineae bacterium]
MTHRVTLIPGDGVGPEVIEAARRVVEATGVAMEWEMQDAGTEAIAKYGTPLPEGLLESIHRNRVALKGPITTPIGGGYRSVNVAIRQALDLYANLRPAKWLPGVPSRFEGVDLVVVRENTEDLYSGIEHEVIPDQAAEAIKIITRRASERVVRFAFQYAQDHGRRKVTAVHKANILKLTDGLFLRVAREVAKDYPDIEFEDRVVDNMCMQLIRKPELYDMLVMPNLYGDILSDLTAGLVGGLGLVPSANIGDHLAVFEPVHGSAPKYAGQDKVNPTAAILSAGLMLHHLGEREAATRIERAVAMVIAQGKRVTYDLKPRADHRPAVGTSEFCQAVVDALSSLD